MEVEKRETAKKAYTSPELVELGTVKEITGSFDEDFGSPAEGSP